MRQRLADRSRAEISERSETNRVLRDVGAESFPAQKYNKIQIRADEYLPGPAAGQPHNHSFPFNATENTFSSATPSCNCGAPRPASPGLTSTSFGLHATLDAQRIRTAYRVVRTAQTKAHTNSTRSVHNTRYNMRIITCIPHSVSSGCNRLPMIKF